MNLSEIQIDRSALVRNVRALRALMTPGVEAIAVVKGNAYGHGLSETVCALEPEVDGFQVDDIEELRALRAVSSKRTLVLGYVGKADVAEAVELGGELAIYDTERLATIAEAGVRHGIRPKVHLKIDALLGRQGVVPSEIGLMVEALKFHPQIDLVSAYAHFANIEDTTDLTHAHDQLEAFNPIWVKLRAKGWPKLGRHLSATSGLMTIESGNDLVRLGIGLYGMYPSAALARRPWDLPLQPVMRWVSHLAQVKTLPPRHPVGYGLTFVTPREMRVGIVPQGYADGFDRGLSNSGEVLVNGSRCSVLGRVAMNMFAIDLTCAPDAAPEDEVVLLGAQAAEEIKAEDLAQRLGTINYEITSRVSPLIPRRLV